MLNRLVENLCYGIRPSDFLRQELTLNAIQNRVAMRIFILLVLFSVIDEVTRMPGSRVIGFFLAVLIPQIALTSRMALNLMVQFTVLLVVAIASGLAIVILFQDQGWFRLPISIGIIILMVFHTRKMRLPPLIPIFFSNLVLYDTGNPVGTVEAALWDLCILIGAEVISCLLIAYLLWPVSARDSLRQRITLRFEGTLALLDDLCQIEPLSLPSKAQLKARHSPGWTAESLRQLDEAIQDDPSMAKIKPYCYETIVELDNLTGGITDYQRLWLDAIPPRPLPQQDNALLHTIRERVIEAHGLFESRGNLRPIDRLPATDAALPAIQSHLLRRQLLASERLIASVDGVYHGDPIPTTPSEFKTHQTPPSWLTETFWIENRALLLWSLKVAFACLIVSLCVISLDTDQVDTAILTTIIVADSTLGADFRKSIMRISGAVIGALLGYLWMTLGQPAVDTIAGLIVTLSPFLFLISRMAATSSRLNYAGLQAGLAFTMTVFSSFSPETYLGVGWYRVLGILLGISVMGVMDYMLWPAKSVEMAKVRIIQTLKEVAAQMSKQPMKVRLNLDLSVYTLRMVDNNVKDAVYFLDFARMEPGSSQPHERLRVSRMDAVIQTVVYLSKIMESRHRLHLRRKRPSTELFIEEILSPLKPNYIQECQAEADALENRKAVGIPFTLLTEFHRLADLARQGESFASFSHEDRVDLETLTELEEKYIKTLLELRSQINDVSAPLDSGQPGRSDPKEVLQP